MHPHTCSRSQGDVHSSNMWICSTNVLLFELKQRACQELQRMVGGYKTEPLSNIVFIKQSCVRLESIKSGGRRSDEIFIKTHHLWAGLKVGSKSDRVSQMKSSEASISSNRHSDQILNIYIWWQIRWGTAQRDVLGTFTDQNHSWADDYSRQYYLNTHRYLRGSAW